jgi:hypothetical protein
MAGLSVVPQVLDLALYAGDGIRIRFTCKDSAGAPVDITGTVKAQIRVERLTPDPPITEFSSNLVDAYQGVVILSLTGVQTKSLLDQPTAAKGKFVGVWDVQWTPNASEPYTLCQGKVECVSDVTR